MPMWLRYKDSFSMYGGIKNSWDIMLYFLIVHLVGGIRDCNPMRCTKMTGLIVPCRKWNS